jgi:hypothetical protein
MTEYDATDVLGTSFAQMREEKKKREQSEQEAENGERSEQED